jgi:hypothetical protein
MDQLAAKATRDWWKNEKAPGGTEAFSKSSATRSNMQPFIKDYFIYVSAYKFSIQGGRSAETESFARTV